jgi:hypothetical protein
MFTPGEGPGADVFAREPEMWIDQDMPRTICETSSHSP